MDTLFDFEHNIGAYEYLTPYDGGVPYYSEGNIHEKFKILQHLNKCEHHLYFKNCPELSLRDIANAAHRAKLSQKIKTLHYDFGVVFRDKNGRRSLYLGELCNSVYKLPATYFPNLKHLSLVSPQFLYQKLEIEQPLESLFAVGLKTLEGINLSEMQVLHIPKNNILDFSALKQANKLVSLDATGTIATDFSAILDLKQLKYLSLPSGMRYASPQLYKTLEQKGCKIQYQ